MSKRGGEGHISAFMSIWILDVSNALILNIPSTDYKLKFWSLLPYPFMLSNLTYSLQRVAALHAVIS